MMRGKTRDDMVEEEVVEECTTNESTPKGWNRAEKMRKMREKMKKSAGLRKEKMFQPVEGEIEIERLQDTIS